MKKQAIMLLIAGLMFSAFGYAEDAAVTPAEDQNQPAATAKTDASVDQKQETNSNDSGAADTATADEDY